MMAKYVSLVLTFVSASISAGSSQIVLDDVFTDITSHTCRSAGMTLKLMSVYFIIQASPGRPALVMRYLLLVLPVNLGLNQASCLFLGIDSMMTLR